MLRTGLEVFEDANVEEFTSSFGLNARKNLNPLWRQALKVGTHRKVILEEYPKLEKGKSYIFIANHSFDEDVISLLSKIDRNVYVLNGSTDQTEHSPLFFALWLNGMVYVDRQDDVSRAESLDKLERVIKNGNSVMIFAEGGYNNSENQLIQPLFNSPYLLAERTGAEVVPIITFNDFGCDTIYIRAGEPIKMTDYEKYESSEILRDEMATILYDIMVDHTEPIKRCELEDYLLDTIYSETKKRQKDRKKGYTRRGDLERVSNLTGNARDYYMELRKLIYEYQHWYNDVWEEELTKYSGHGVTTPEEARKYLENVKITPENAAIFAPQLVRYADDQHYDLKKYLSKNLELRQLKR